MLNKVIFTSENGDEQIALNEIKKISSISKKVDYLAKGICLVELDENYWDFIKKINNKNLIFVRHIMPVMSKSKISNNNIIEQIYSPVNNNISFLDKNLRFSVQARVINTDVSLKAFDINNFISGKLTENNFKLDIKHPEQIVSVLICRDEIYIGLSLKKDNLSSWSGGNIRFEKKDDFISRAEFKLLEAIHTFDLNLHKKALDLGAAPGGWTKILSETCDSVTAVDPAELHESLLSKPNIIHKKITAQQFFREASGKFNVITNDMKMDVNESIDIMKEAKSFLAPDGICVMTLKLPQSNQQKKVYKSIEILEKYFDILYARKLFHNRSEATVIFSNKNI